MSKARIVTLVLSAAVGVISTYVFPPEWWWRAEGMFFAGIVIGALP